MRHAHSAYKMACEIPRGNRPGSRSSSRPHITNRALSSQIRSFSFQIWPHLPFDHISCCMSQLCFPCQHLDEHLRFTSGPAMLCACDRAWGI